MSSGRPRLVAYLETSLRRIAAGLAAGLVAGFVAGGVGGRVMMRLLAVTSDPATAGMITDDDAVVGEMTVGGTIFFVLFTTFGLAVFALVFVALRRFLPGTGWKRGAFFGLLVAGLFALAELHPEEKDMTVLGPQPLPVLLTFVALPLLYGGILGALTDRFEVFYGRIRLRSPQVLAFAVLAPLVMPFFLVPVVAAVAVSFAAGSIGPIRKGWAAPLVTRGGRVVVLAAVAALAVVGVTRAADIEPRPITSADFAGH